MDIDEIVNRDVFGQPRFSAIRTPVIDQLGAAGLNHSQFQTAFGNAVKVILLLQQNGRPSLRLSDSIFKDEEGRVQKDKSKVMTRTYALKKRREREEQNDKTGA